MFTADGVLTIYSLGDSIFLSNVLNGIAMITTGGDSSTDRGSFLYITAIGAMFGFILTALRGLQTGKAFDLNSLMLCIIAWYFFFGWNIYHTCCGKINIYLYIAMTAGFIVVVNFNTLY